MFRKLFLRGNESRKHQAMVFVVNVYKSNEDVVVLNPTVVDLEGLRRPNSKYIKLDSIHNYGEVGKALKESLII
ncbi:hypothetical protein [Paenibacillus cremeus]|uniref:Uncharacterized protein n=1 Tax=Paenibacillus cremeus TaxID=2163881 RepID=A0A559K0J5_9BACL|nr:hypothetical protein [Paenibacillus cremeus]TVY05607.1 hypothetical protein FPZ49_29440 [Paenibacillus cremeus]